MRIVASGAPLAQARAAAVLVHGRGGSAEDRLALAEEFSQRDIAYLAPEAPGHTWYPYSFLAPLAQNEPHLTNALATVGAAVQVPVQFGLRCGGQVPFQVLLPA